MESHVVVESYHYENASYNFTGGSIVQAIFGFLDGSLNAFPKGGLMSNCGINLRAQRYEVLNLTEQIGNRDLIQVVDRFYNFMGYTYDTTFNCYYGISQFLNLANI